MIEFCIYWTAFVVTAYVILILIIGSQTATVPPSVPTAPTVGLSLPRGESVMRIIYRDVEVPAGNPQQNIVTTRVFTLIEGAPGPALQQDISGNGGKVDIIVPEGSSGKVWFIYIDGSVNSNASPPSPETPFVNANDTTPPDAPVGGLSLGKGESIPDA